MKLIKILTVFLAYLTSTICFADAPEGSSVEGLGCEIEEVTKTFEIVKESSDDINFQTQLFIQTQLERMSYLEKDQDQK